MTLSTLMLAATTVQAGPGIPARPPVVIVPGSLHSALEASDSRGQWWQVYLNWTALKPPESAQRAWIELMAFNTSGQYPPAPATDAAVRAKYGPDTARFGNLSSIPLIDPWTFPKNSSYVALIHFLQNNGYTADCDLFAAPYDWRRAPDTLQSYFQALRALIERVHETNGRPVALVGHSAGPSVVLYFLTKLCSPAWKAKHIHSFVSLNGNLAGEIDCLENLWEGGDFIQPAAGVSTWPTALYRNIAQWSWGITAWCMPSPAVYGDRPLVKLGNVTYSARNLSALFGAFGAKKLQWVYEHVANLTSPPINPGVRVACLYGTALPTPVMYEFAEGQLGAPTHIITASGDGQQDDTTNSICRSFRGTFDARAFPGADHDSLLADSRLLHHLITNVLL